MKKSCLIIILLVAFFNCFYFLCSFYDLPIKKDVFMEFQHDSISSNPYIDVSPDTLQHLYLKTIEQSSVGFAPGRKNGLFFYSKEEYILIHHPEWEKSDEEKYCFDYKDGMAVIILGNNSEESPIRVLSTEDGGKNFFINNINIDTDIIDKMFLELLDKQQGYFVFNTKKNNDKYNIYITNNGCKSFEYVNTFTIPNVEKTAEIYYSAFDPFGLGFLCGEKDSTPFIFRTDDGGLSWEEIKITAPKNELLNSAYVSSEPFFYNGYGILTINNYNSSGVTHEQSITYYLSNDYGKTWTTLFRMIS